MTAQAAHDYYLQDLRDEAQKERDRMGASKARPVSEKGADGEEARKRAHEARTNRECNTLGLREKASTDNKFLGELLRIAFIGTRIARKSAVGRNFEKGDVALPWPPIRWGEQCKCYTKQCSANACECKHVEDCWKVCEEA